jgi:hypothetical protein
VTGKTVWNVANAFIKEMFELILGTHWRRRFHEIAKAGPAPIAGRSCAVTQSSYRARIR